MKVVMLALTSLLLSACSTLSVQTDALVKSPSVPEKIKLPNVPFIEQEENYCGPASLAMVLGYRGRPLSQEEISAISYTKSKKGTFQADLISAARREGMLAVRITGMHSLLKEISEGHPVIVFQNLGFSFYPRWHYAVAFGYDLDGPDIVLHSGDEKNEKMDLRFFERSWTLAGQWGLVIVPPGELIQSADEVQHLEAATGLERAGRSTEAESSYRAILSRWPDSLVALIGMGNVHYTRKDYKKAVRYLEIATRAHPSSEIARHNLETARRALTQ